MKTILAAIVLAALAAPGFLQAQDARLDQYVAISNALAQDDLGAARTAATKLSQESGPLAIPASSVAKADSLDAARQSFRTLSSEAEKLAAGQSGYHVFTCPMAGADWVQKSTTVQNPYMGKQMSSCGSLKDAPSTSPMKAGGCCG